MKVRKVLVLVALSVSCNQVLGIEDAHVDSALVGGRGGASVSGSLSVSAGADQVAGGSDDQGGTSSGGSGGSGGSAAVAGSNGSKAGSGGSEPLPSGGGSPSDGGAPPVTASVCEAYCDAVMTNCKGKYEQYRNFEQCIEVCKKLPEGTSDDANSNSVHCRMRQAAEAEVEPFVYCKAAGPLGAGKCGSNCVSYCSLMQATCTPESTGDNLEPSYYPDSQTCLTQCGLIPTHEDDPTEYSSSTTVTPSSLIGNTVYCRTYHIASGLEQDTPDEHCPHAMGAFPCDEQ